MVSFPDQLFPSNSATGPRQEQSTAQGIALVRTLRRLALQGAHSPQLEAMRRGNHKRISNRELQRPPSLQNGCVNIAQCDKKESNVKSYERAVADLSSVTSLQNSCNSHTFQLHNFFTIPETRENTLVGFPGLAANNRTALNRTKKHSDLPRVFLFDPDTNDWFFHPSSFSTVSASLATWPDLACSALLLV